MGRRMMTQSQLNMSWMVAPANALRNSFLSIDWNMATIVFVTDVPMFAPITMKMAGLMGKTATANRQLVMYSFELVLSSYRNR